MLKKVNIRLVEPLTSPQFIHTKVVTYDIDGEAGRWEVAEQHDSVHVFVYNDDTDEALFVKQVRIPVLLHSPETNGEVIECCAGIIDKYSELEPLERAYKIAIDEVHEELGYAITREDLEFVKLLHGSVGTAGSKCYTFIATVTDNKFIGQKLEPGEDIEVFKVAADYIEDVMDTEETDAVTSFLSYRFITQC